MEIEKAIWKLAITAAAIYFIYQAGQGMKGYATQKSQEIQAPQSEKRLNKN